MRSFLLLIVLGSLVLFSCNNSTSDKTNTKGDSTGKTVAMAPPQSVFNQEGTDELVKMVQAYYKLKDAFVATKADDADAAASRLESATELFRHNLKSYGSDSTGRMAAALTTIMSKSTELISIKDDPKCLKKRASFEGISDGMYALLQLAQLKNVVVYREFCPMAFDNKGAYWLSDDPEIKNPYFGDKMLECGEVTDTIGEWVNRTIGQ